MAEVSLTLTKLVLVEGLDVGPDGATARFGDGAGGALPLGHWMYAHCVELLEDGLKKRKPVGVSFGPDAEIKDVWWADADVVKWFGEEHEDPVEVFFWGHHGLYRLRHSHPDFARLYAIAKRSAEQKEWVWFIASPFPLTLLDLVPKSHFPPLRPAETNGVAP